MLTTGGMEKQMKSLFVYQTVALVSSYKYFATCHIWMT